jgi:zinc transport system substrate-binding protein
MKKMLVIIIVFLFAVGFLSLSIFSQKKPNNNQKINIVTTLFPLYDFAKIVGGDKVEVSLLLPPGVEPHGFEPTPSDIIKINQAEIFVYTGKFMEPWAEDIIKGISDGYVKAVNASLGIQLMGSDDNHRHNEEYGEMSENNHHDDESGHRGNIDPHIWLDFDNAKIIVDNILKSLIEKDPDNTSFYQNNAQKYSEELNQLNERYKTALLKCQSRELIYGGHYAFGYLAKKYNLNYSATQRFLPDAEPTASDLISLIEQIKQNNIQYIFYQELTSPKIAEMIASETKTQLLLLNGAHNLNKDDFENKVSFLSIMDKNLANLKIGLKCVE